jgi:hypothetical protein
MMHFRYIGTVDPAPLVNAAIRYSGQFAEDTWRQDFPGSPHQDSESIYLRMPSEISVDSIFNSLEVSNLPLMRDYAFADACKAISLMTIATVKRVMLVKLKAGGKVTPHIDQGAYAEATERYHLPVITNPDCLMTSGDETVHLPAGEVWWFDKHALHSVVNNGPDRIHLIVDVVR